MRALTHMVIGLLAAAIGREAAGQADTTAQVRTAGSDGELYRLVKRFDFDERKLGNYENTPMHWTRLAGDGLPAYSSGAFDDQIGQPAPPSFRLTIQTGNVAYEYRAPDLTVVPQSDYLVTAQVRAEKLENAHAFLVGYFVDGFAERIPGSERVSRIIAATGEAREPWQRIELELPGEFPTAATLRLQVWILQDYVWREVDPRAVDPIVRRDVHACAGFDDIAIYRLPRARLRFSHPAGLVAPGRQEFFLLDLHNATAQAMRAELQVFDAQGRACHKQNLEVPAQQPPETSAPVPAGKRPADGTRVLGHVVARSESPSVRAPVPDLPPGLYTARLRLLSGPEALLQRELRFAVLTELPASSRLQDVGVDLGPWRGQSLDGLLAAISDLRCGAVKLGLPLGDDVPPLGELIPELARHRIDLTPALLPAAASADSPEPRTLRAMLASVPDWQRRLGPLLANLGGLLTTWQLGAEGQELREGAEWSDAEIQSLRESMRRFVSAPELIVPRRVTNIDSADPHRLSVWVPAEIPTRDLAAALDWSGDRGRPPRWVRLQGDGRPRDSERHVRELVQRFVLAKAAGAQRTYVDAPFDIVSESGAQTWQPTEDFLVLRTLFHYLSGKRAIGVLKPEPDTLAIIFRDASSSVLVAWTWRDRPLSEPVEVYLGGAPRLVDLWGRAKPLPTEEGKVRLAVGPMPILVDGFDACLALLDASYRLSPTTVQISDPEPRPTVRFTNPFDTALTGELDFTPPAGWTVTPQRLALDLAPGETLEQPLTFKIPERQPAGDHRLSMCLKVKTPQTETLRYVEHLGVGLKNIEIETAARWDGHDLVVEQSLKNLTEKPVRFMGYCEAPARPRQETVFIDIPPGDTAVQSYVFPAADGLAGALIHAGVEELRGQRKFSQLVEVPR